MHRVAVCLHGFLRTGGSMWMVARSLRAAGYREVLRPTFGYHFGSLQAHGERAAGIITALSERHPNATIDVVTHSYGGILARVALAHLEARPGARVRRVVMLSPPNQGARLAGQIRGLLPLHAVGWDPLHQLLPGVPSEHPAPAHPQIGILTGGNGSRGYTPWLGDDNDGKVCVEEARLPGVHDFHVIPLRHAWMPFATVAHRQINAFLETGAFER